MGEGYAAGGGFWQPSVLCGEDMSIPFPDKKYQIIYADPPWSYKVWSEDKTAAQGCAKRYYQTMSINDICAMPVKDIAAPDCKLFLWATPPCLPEAIKVVEAWGFEYKTVAFCWVKTNKKNFAPFFGIGHWTASNAELCLAGMVKGGKLNRQSKSISQVILSPRNGHSKKPYEVRDKIVQLCGDLPRIELLARQRTPGWDCWGNEVQSSGANVTPYNASIAPQGELL